MCADRQRAGVLEKWRIKRRTDIASKATNARRAGTNAALLNWGGLCIFARNASSITKSKNARSAQPNHADHARMYVSVPSRRSGASQNSLWGRLISATGIAAMIPGIPKETTVANIIMASSVAKNAALVCQPLTNPPREKCDPRISGTRGA